jgi:two-component system CheB/CheR fusion protein
VSPKSPFLDTTHPQNTPAGVLVSANGDTLYLYNDTNFPLDINEIPTNNAEGLQLINEELQSTNEELQSTNEELETSKEEMQSLNEELSTVNAELQTKVIELSQVNNDMNNLLSGTGIATLFVDQNLCILRYTPSVTHLINVIASDIGRPVGHITSSLNEYHTLEADTKAVLDTLLPKEIKVQTIAGRWYMMHIIPYRTLENIVKGAVITFVDITEIMRAQESLRHMVAIVRDAYDAITVQDLKGDILAWNPSAVRMYGWSEEQALMMNVRSRIPEEKREQALEKIVQLSHDEVLEPYLTQRLCQDGTIKEVWITATALVDDKGKIYAITTTERLNETQK